VTAKRILVNRAPVLTLWAAVVAERLGYDEDAALTLGKGVAGLNAQSKGRRLGIFEPPSGMEARRRAEKRPRGFRLVPLLGRGVPALKTPKGLRATVKDEPVDPATVRRYLESKFGDDLGEVESAMKALARALGPDELEERAYSLYERFRPSIPEGKRGWGAKGELDLAALARLAKG
jgi:hypothetical protein